MNVATTSCRRCAKPTTCSSRTSRRRNIRESSSRTISSWTSGDVAGAPGSYLFLRGWIYPTDASINVALGTAVGDQDQRRRRSRCVTRRASGKPPSPSIGFPSGKNKTMIIDLAGKFPTADHHVRIRTNMQIYWDQAFVARDLANSAAKITTLRAAVRRPALPRFLPHVPEGRPLRPVLVRVRRCREGNAVAADRGRVHALRRRAASAPEPGRHVRHHGRRATRRRSSSTRAPRTRCPRDGSATSCSTAMAGSRTLI